MCTLIYSIQHCIRNHTKYRFIDDLNVNALQITTNRLNSGGNQQLILPYSYIQGCYVNIKRQEHFEIIASGSKLFTAWAVPLMYV